MRKIYLFITAIFSMAVMTNAQVVFQSNFSSWSGGNPTDWMGAKTSIENDSVVEITTGSTYGTSSAQLINVESSHKRFTTQAVHVDKDSVYEISFWVKGEGQIRTAMWEGSYSAYNSYIDVNTSSWTKYKQSVTAPGTGDDGEFIISVRYTVAGSNHLELDSVAVVMKSSEVTPIDLTIKQIQDTTGTGSEASPYADSVVITGGIVTAVSNYGYFMQSGTGMWSGIFVSDTNTTALGDSVKIQGTVFENYGFTTIKSVTNFTIVSSGNTVPTPENISTGDANLEGYESVLIKVSSATCLTADLGYGEWSVKDATSDSVRIDDMMYTFSAIEDSAYDITGPLNYSYGNFKIEPRNRNDISGPEKLIPVTIHDIQYTTDASGDSPYKDSVVSTGGIVTALVAGKGYFLQSGSGAWNGIYVYDTGNDTIARGDSVTFKAKVSEYNNLTELSSISDFVIVSSGNTLPTAVSVASANVSEEQYESVLIKSTGTCVSDDLGYGEWGISDNTTDTVHIDDLFYAFTPIQDSSYTVTGIDYYSYGSFKIEPRDSNDIIGPRVTVSFVSIHDIQYTTDASGDSPYKDSTVSTGGIVTAIVPNKGYYVQSGSGAWNGIYVYDKNNAVARGDSITFKATVSEYYNLTELSYVTDFVKVSSGNTVPEATLVTAADFNTEQYEGVLVKATGTCLSADLGYGEWAVSENTTDTIHVDDLLYAFTPIKDSSYTVTGISYFSYGAYKLEPRDSNDVIGPKYVMQAVSIHDIQYTTDASGDSPYDGLQVSTGGIVTAIVAGKGYFIQSGSGAWNGVYVYDKNNAVARGDSVTFTTKVSEYYAFTELGYVTDFVKVSSGNALPEPLILSTGTVPSEKYEGVLVKVTGTCTNPDLGYGKWEVDDGTGGVAIDSLMYSYTPTSYETYTVTGPVNYNHDYAISPRDADDVIKSTGIISENTDNVLKLYPNPATTKFTVEASEVITKIAVYNILGENTMVVNPNTTRTVINVTTMKTGVYFVKVYTQKQTKTIKLKVVN